jgi:hypothetical protein
MPSKIYTMLLFVIVALLTGCGPSVYTQTATQVTSVNTAYERCLAGLQITQSDRSLYQLIFPDLKKIGFEQKTNQDLPSEGDVTQMTPVIEKRLNCERILIDRMSSISGLRGNDKATVNRLVTLVDIRLRGLENAAAGLVLGKYSYGEYFTRYEAALSRAKNSASDLKAQYNQQQYQSAPASTPVFKPYCPPSKYPIYGCGNATSPSTSSNRNPPPGNKTCSYKSGPYQWTKTISGFTCPPTDSSNGYFGTLVR